LILVHFGGQVAYAMGEAALPRRARKVGLDRLDDRQRTVADDQEQIAEVTRASPGKTPRPFQHAPSFCTMIGQKAIHPICVRSMFDDLEVEVLYPA
jgi:hypothetical protein